MRLVEDAPSARSSCSATRRWPTRPTPYPRCSTHPPSPARASTRGSWTWCRAAPACRPAERRRLAVRRAHRRRPRRRREPWPGAWSPHAGAPTPDRHRPRRAAALWRIREDGAGLAARSAEPPGARRLGGRRRPARSGSALPARLRRAARATRSGRRALRPLRRRLRARADRLRARRPRGRAGTGRSWSDAADLVGVYGGSLSGEHGDGRARSELLPRMYSPDAIAPVRSRSRRSSTPTTCSTRACSSTRPRSTPTSGSPRRSAPLRTDAAADPRRRDFAGAVHRCTGVGKCLRRQHRLGRGDVPVVPGDPRREGLHPGPRPGASGRRRRRPRGFDDPAVARRARPVPVLQGLRADCPTGIDMATYKSEALLHQSLPRGRLRPRSHYALGQLPRWARTDAARRLANTMLRSRALGRGWPCSAAGVDQRRSLPALLADIPCAAPARRSLANVASCSWPTPSPIASPPDTGQARRSRCWRQSGCARRIPEPTLLRADLDHHRPARRRDGSSARPSRRCTATSRAACRSSPSSRAASPCSGGRRPAARRPARREVSAGPHARRAARAAWRPGWTPPT